MSYTDLLKQLAGKTISEVTTEVSPDNEDVKSITLTTTTGEVLMLAAWGDDGYPDNCGIGVHDMTHQSIISYETSEETEVAIEHKGVIIYHSYNDDDYQRPLTYGFSFGFHPETHVEKTFDVRDLSTFRNAKGDMVEEAAAIKLALKQAIDSGELK
jgi:hypothetical protein